MKFCYIDESGTGDEPFAVMAGIIVDAKRMHLTKDDWDELLSVLSGIVGKEVPEIHTRDFYPGNSPWREMAGEMRARLITAIFDWLRIRKHSVVFVGVDKSRFYAQFPSSKFAPDIGTLWRFMATHLVLALQKHHQTIKQKKGHTLLVFDNEEKEAKDFISLVKNPPPWTDTYYSRGKNQGRLDQVIDVPYFGDSTHVGLIQLADFVSYFLRRHLEVLDGVVPPRYEGEGELVASWAQAAFDRSIPPSMTYPLKGRCPCAEFFFSFAPKGIMRAA
jgi:hypothetical protein